MNNESDAVVAEQNNRFRKGDPHVPGTNGITMAVSNLLDKTEQDIPALMSAIKQSADENANNMCDRGQLSFSGKAFVWRVELYDSDFRNKPKDPSDLKNTMRVLVVSLESEP